MATAVNSCSNVHFSSKMTLETPCAASTKTAQNNARHFQLTRGVYPKLTSTALTPLAQSLPYCKLTTRNLRKSGPPLCVNELLQLYSIRLLVYSSIRLFVYSSIPLTEPKTAFSRHKNHAPFLPLTPDNLSAQPGPIARPARGIHHSASQIRRWR